MYRLTRVVAVAVALIGALQATPHGDGNPFGFLAPDVLIDVADRQRLNVGETFVRVLPGRDGHLALTAAVRTDVSSERFLAWMTNVEALQKGRYVPQIQRFSNPPQIEDLAALVFEDEDLEDIRRCRPGKCGVKLSDVEIASLQGYLGGVDWKERLQGGLRDVVLRRALDYLAHGDAGALPYHDDADPVAPAVIFDSLIARLKFLPTRFGCLTDYTRRFPYMRDPHVVDSFLYWSKESLGAKPIISITHLTLARFNHPDLPAAVAVAKQVFATHYKNGSITVTALTGSVSSGYLVYVHRSQVDVLQGFLGGVVRRMVERRVREEAPGVLGNLRKRLEIGDPPKR